MNTDTAKVLAVRIASTWHGGPKIPEWVEYLAALDEGTAGTALARLIRSEEHSPSIAKFNATYKALHTASRAEHDHPGCDWCDSTGFVDCLDDRRHASYCNHRGTKPLDVGDCHCHAVDPCPQCRRTA